MGDSATTNTENRAIEPTGHTGPAPASGAAQVDLRFDLLFSALYHDMCEARFLRYHRWLTAVSLLMGTAAVAAFMSQYPWLGPVAGLMVAVASTVQLVWDFAGRAHRHGDLRQRFYNLLADLERGGTEDDLRSQMISAYGAEPPIVEKLRRRAHNQAGASLFGEDYKKA